jgi:hypothetical protein
LISTCLVWGAELSAGILKLGPKVLALAATRGPAPAWIEEGLDPVAPLPQASLSTPLRRRGPICQLTLQLRQTVGVDLLAIPTGTRGAARIAQMATVHEAATCLAQALPQLREQLGKPGGIRRQIWPIEAR